MERERKVFAVFWLAILFLSIILGFLGLAYENEFLSFFALGIFVAAFFFLCEGLYARTARDKPFWWFKHLVHSLGSFKILSIGYEMPEYVEGSLFLSILTSGLYIFGSSIAGAFSYMCAEIPSQVWYVLTQAAIMSSMVMHYTRLTRMRETEKLFKDGQTRSAFLKRLNMVETFVHGKPGILAFSIGVITVNILAFQANLAESRYSKMVFYVREAYSSTLQLVVEEPITVLGQIVWHICTSILWGLLTVGILATLVTLSLMSFLDTDMTIESMELNFYEPWPLKRVTEMLASFWALTSAGLVILPLWALTASSLAAAGKPSAGLFSMVVYCYPIFLVSFFIISSLKVKRFISNLKAKAAKRIYIDLQNAQKYSLRQKLTSELSLIDRVPEGPPGTAFMQLFQIAFAIILALLNLYLK